MALSNIFREPRREIIESAVGIAGAAICGGSVVWLAYQFGVWLEEYAGYWQTSNGTMVANIPWDAGMTLSPAVAILGWGVLVATHAIGEGICGALQNRGIHLRPRNRP